MKKVLVIIMWLIAITAIFVMIYRSFDYLTLEFQSDYFIRRGITDTSLLWKISFMLHVYSGVLFWILALFQVLVVYQPKLLSVHPKTGRVSVILVVICALSGFYSSLTGLGVPGFKAGLLFSFAIWIGMTLMAVYRIKQRNVEAHINWMIRSIIISLSILTFRGFYVFFHYLLGFEYEDSFTLSGVVLFVNIALAEIAVKCRPAFDMQKVLSNAVR